MTGRWLALVVVVVFGWGALELMLRQMQIGEHALSPQHFELPEGLTVIVGGGRATLTFVDAPYLRSARLRVKCKDVDRGIQLRPQETSDETCGVRVHLIQIFAGQAAVRVSWGEAPDAGPDAAAHEEEKPLENENSLQDSGQRDD